MRSLTLRRVRTFLHSVPGRPCRGCNVPCMSLADIAFLLGPLGALVVVPLAVAVLGVRRHPMWAVWLSGALALAVAVSWLGYWFLWGKAFNYANALQQGPERLNTALGVTMTVAAVGSVGLALTAVTALVHPRPPR
jgi:hypothetical protein